MKPATLDRIAIFVNHSNQHFSVVQCRTTGKGTTLSIRCCSSEAAKPRSSSLISLLLKYIDTGGDLEFAALAECLSSYAGLSNEHRLRFPTWLWEKRKIQWVYKRLMDEFPDTLHEDKAEKYAINLAYMLGSTFRVDMHNEDSHGNVIILSLDDSRLKSTTVDGENPDNSSDGLSESHATSDMVRDDEDDEDNADETPEYIFLKEAEIRSEAEKEALERLIRIIVELPVLYRIAIFLVDVYPILGMPEDRESRVHIELLAGVSLDEVEDQIETALNAKWKSQSNHRYPLKVSDAARILHTNENTVSQWLSRGRRLLRDRYREASCGNV